MKKLTVLFVTMAFLVFGASSVMAAGATEVKDFGCHIIPADSGLPVDISTTNKTKAVEAKSGNVNFTCHFKYDTKKYPIKQTLKHSGFPCVTQFGVTKDTSAVTAPGGKITLVCKIKPPKPEAKPVKK
jgi:hypothetical protein